MSYLKRYDKQKNIRNVTEVVINEKNEPVAYKIDGKPATADEVDELLILRFENDIRKIKQRMATRKHREKKNVR